MNSFGRLFRVSIFGESHGPLVGVTLDGVPAGIALDEKSFEKDLNRRKSGKRGTTPRKESDLPEIATGLFQGRTTGAPLTVLFRNENTLSGDYANLVAHPRPSHSDWVAARKFGGFNDYRGGGHFSGRLTAPLVFAGAIAKLILKEKGVEVTSRISNVAGIADPTPEEIEAAILAAKADLDSVGGRIACAVTGLPAGLGAPDFGCNVEGIFSQYLFAVPAVKGVDFGAGVAFSLMRGSEANDPLTVKDGRVTALSNHSGGVNGGISNGMPLIFRSCVRPTPSIYKEQQTVDLAKNEAATLQIQGRHDPCILHRAAIVQTAATAFGLLDLLTQNGGGQRQAGR